MTDIIDIYFYLSVENKEHNFSGKYPLVKLGIWGDYVEPESSALGNAVLILLEVLIFQRKIGNHCWMKEV